MADKSNLTKTKPKYKRKTHVCPVCQKSFTHIPRHLEQKHKWSHEKALEAMSVFDLRARAKKVQCPVKDCVKSAADVRHHLQMAHGMSDEQIESTLSKPPPKQAGTSVKEKREFRRRVCPYPGCNKVVRKIHHHLTTGKHKLSRDDPRYREYLRDASFVELQGTAEEPVIVSSNEDSNPSDTDGSKTVIDENGHETANESSTDLSTEEEEEMLKKIRKQKSDHAKAIMRYGAEYWRQKEQTSTPVQNKASTRKRKYHVQSSEDDESEYNIIPPSPDNERQSIFHKQGVLPHRNPGSLPGEQGTSTLWDEAGSGVNPSGATRQDKNGDPTVVVNKKKHPAKKVKETSGGFSEDDESSEDTSGEDEYKPHDDESDGEDDEEEEGQSEEDGEQELKELGACGNSTTELVLDSFKHWLQGIDGGNRELRTARQYVSQISAIISEIDPVQQNVSCIIIIIIIIMTLFKCQMYLARTALIGDTFQIELEFRNVGF